MITIQMNGVTYKPSDIDGLAEFTLSAKVTDGVLERQLSNELTFRGTAYDYLKTVFIDSPSAIVNKVIVVVADDCCDNYSFSALITLLGVSFCYGACEMKVRLVEYNPPFTCFKSTVIFDDWNGFQQRTDHPRVTYCNELRPNWLMHVIMILTLILETLLIILVPVIAVVSIVISVVCAIINLPFVPGHCPPDLSNGILDDYTNFMKQLEQSIIGCGRQHPSPLVRDYVKNVCDKCGLNFVSSILNNPASEYYNSLYFNAPVKKGCKPCTIPLYDNYPLLAVDMLFEQMKPLFAAEYTIRGTDLVFDRRDKIKLSNIIFDFQGADRSKLENLVCYSWNGKPKPAYANFQYTKDLIDLVGSEALNHYNDIVDYNNPLNIAFSGSLEKQFQFGTPRFRKDGIEEDVLAAYEGIPFVGGWIKPFDTCLLLAQHTAELPKLLIWDGASTEDARVKIYPTPYGYEALYPQVGVNAPYELYNYPYYVDADFNTAQKNLYEFQKLEDPRDLTIKNLTFDVTFKYECGDLEKLTIWSGIILDQGIGTIEEYEINFAKHTVELHGTV